MRARDRILWVIISLVFTPVYFFAIWNTKPVFDWKTPYWVDLLGNLIFTPFILIASLVAVGYALRDVQRTKSIGAALFGFYNLGLGAAILIIVHAQVYEEMGLLTTSDKLPELTRADYIYFSIITWTTVGYGDIIPSVAARPYAAEEAILGYIYMAAYISYMFNALVLLSDYDFTKMLEGWKKRIEERVRSDRTKAPDTNPPRAS